MAASGKLQFYTFNGLALTCPETETTRVVPLTCHGHSRPITHLSFSSLQPSSTSSAPSYYLVSACKDNNPMLRDGTTGDWIGTFVGHKGAVWSARLSSDASLALTGSADFSARLWDTFSGECLAVLSHSHIVRAVAFQMGTDKTTTVATGGMEKRLRIWNIEAAVPAATANADVPHGTSEIAADQATEVAEGVHGGTIKSIVWTSDPNVLITAADDGYIRWFDLQTPATAIASHAVEGAIGSCEMGDMLRGMDAGVLSVAAGKNVYLFDSAQKTLIKRIDAGHVVSSVAVCGPTRQFVTGASGDTWVRVWDYDTEQPQETAKGHHGPVWTAAYSPDGKLYATGSEDGTIKLWKATKDPYGLWK